MQQLEQLSETSDLDDDMICGHSHTTTLPPCSKYRLQLPKPHTYTTQLPGLSWASLPGGRTIGPLHKPTRGSKQIGGSFIKKTILRMAITLLTTEYLKICSLYSQASSGCECFVISYLDINSSLHHTCCQPQVIYTCLSKCYENIQILTQKESADCFIKLLLLVLLNKLTERVELHQSEKY